MRPESSPVLSKSQKRPSKYVKNSAFTHAGSQLKINKETYAMFVKEVARKSAYALTGFLVAIGLNVPTFAQSASEISIYQAGYNAGIRLQREGFSLDTAVGAPSISLFLRSGETRQVRFNVPRTGRYILLVGGDNDTVDLDVYFRQANINDVSFGNTALIDFDVFRPGEFLYEIHMLRCQAGNCGVHAVLLREYD